MLSNLDGKLSFSDGNRKRIINHRQFALVEAHVNNRTHYLSYLSYM